MKTTTVRFELMVAILALVVAGYFVRDAVSAARATITTLDTISAEGAGPRGQGAGVWIGTVARADVAAPAALSGNHAFTGRMGRWVGSGKSRRFDVFCAFTRVDGLSFAETTTRKTFVLRGFDRGAVGFASGVTNARDRAAVDFTHESRSSSEPTSDVRDGRDARVPKRLEAECGDMPAGAVEYEERHVERGEEITVRGCLNESFIAPCGDGLDYVTDRSVTSIKRATRDHHAGTVAGGALALFVALGIIGIMASRAVVRSTRGKVAS